MTHPGAARPRPGAPWWVVVSLAAVVVVLAVGLVLSLTRGEAAAPTTSPTTDVTADTSTGRDATPIELPASIGGYEIPADDPTGLDREATRRQITGASGAGADVATYADDDGPAFTATAARLDALPLFSVQRAPEEAADVVTQVVQVGDVRCQTSGQEPDLLVLQCQDVSPDLTVSVVPLDPGGRTVEGTADLTRRLSDALD